ncbi:MAG TPA: hypothetical protein VGK19_21350 [Capsulimonadaceae bacterium]
MPRDNNAVLQTPITKTASFNSAGFDLGAGTPRRGMKASVRVSAITGTDAAAAFKVQHSADNANFTDLAFARKASMTAVGETSVSFETDKRYIRLTATIAGTTPSVTYEAWIVPARP